MTYQQQDYDKAIFEVLKKIDSKLALLTPMGLEELTPEEQVQALHAKLTSVSLEQVVQFVETDPQQIALREAKKAEEHRRAAERARLAGGELDETGDYMVSALRSGFQKFVKPTYDRLEGQ